MDEETVVEAKVDKRLKLTLNTSSKPFLIMKADLERREGRGLSTDEVMLALIAEVDVRSPDVVSANVTRMLRELKEYLRDHREQASADIVEMFAPALLDVLRGKIEARVLMGAITDVE